MEEKVLRLVWLRARNCCEYCRRPQSCDETPFQIDHVIARKHGGGDDPRNLALPCMACNNDKGPNIAGLDPWTGHLVRLFDPRTDQWSEHFVWDGPTLQGMTPIGRATVTVLAINIPFRVELRNSLLAEGISLAGPAEEDKPR